MAPASKEPCKKEACDIQACLSPKTTSSHRSKQLIIFPCF
ncbi:hypothetical protein OIU79_022602 [Salix purpurea]|uniref:Uncharacterized protein n=1 Tax=Salix purpurea TaxID=77065 RepID=A0A9Q0WH74_SALPP|nr:hypothetical protein OIU79_022602 [Salix purpurea]